MLSLHSYILESLSSQEIEFFKGILASQTSINASDSGAAKIDMDEKSISAPPDKTFDESAFKDAAVKQIICDPKLGLQAAAMIIKSPGKYLKDDKGDDIKVTWRPYFYVDNADAAEETSKTTYLAGIVMWGEPPVDGTVGIIDIEPSLIAKNEDDVTRVIFNDFSAYMKRKQNGISGASSSTVLIPVKNRLMKLGFTSMQVNKNIMIGKLA